MRHFGVLLCKRMPFVPKLPHEEVERMIAAGGVSAFEIYRLKHQHPLNRLTHFIGIPMIAISIAFPLFAWFAWGVVAWKEWIILSAVGWGLQLLGHAIEGNQPAFFQDPRHMIIGPLYFLSLPLLRVRARATDRWLSSGEDRKSHQHRTLLEPRDQTFHATKRQ